MNVVVAIERDVPLPRQRRFVKPRGGWKVIFAAMKVGESILAPRRPFTMHLHYGRMFGHRYTSQKEGDGLRVWRVA